MFRRALLPVALVCLCSVTSPAAATGKGAQQTHLVMKGQRLGSIAKRYNVSVEALAYANGIRQRDPIKPGQRLVIPDRSDKDGSEARAANGIPGPDERPTRRAALEHSNGRRRSGPAWLDYARSPKRKNWVELTTASRKWRGLVIDAKGHVRAAARTGISDLLGASGDHPGAPERLLRLIVEVSNTFGGRPIHIVSGYRTTSFFRDSRHKTSQAVDFAIAGVPNAVARDYLMTLDNVGVGYYPNSTFLHLDVRPHSTHWTDYAGPGEAPRKTPHGAAQTPVDFDELAEQAAESGSAQKTEAAPGDSSPSPAPDPEPAPATRP
jgi:LysM repeat protein